MPSSPRSPLSPSPPHHHRRGNAFLVLPNATSLPGVCSTEFLSYSGHCSLHQHGSCPTTTLHPEPCPSLALPAAAVHPAWVRDIAAPELGFPKPHGRCVQHRSKGAGQVALGGDKGRDMPRPVPLPLLSRVSRATLSPSACRSKGQSCRFPRVFPGIFSVWEAPLTMMVLKVLTPSCSRYKSKKLPSATCG